MKPSEIDFGVPPFVGTFNSSEVEATIFALVRACAHKGDVFGPIEPEDVGRALDRDVDAGGDAGALWRNPFLRPDFTAARELGFTELVCDDDSESIAKAPVRLTGLALLRLRRFWRGTDCSGRLGCDGPTGCRGSEG